MNHQHCKLESRVNTGRGFSRRGALRCGVGGVAGAAMFWLTHDRARAADGKLTKAALGYVEVSNVVKQDCDDCVQFVPGATARSPGTCKIVEGTISPHGHCIAFAPKA